VLFHNLSSVQPLFVGNVRVFELGEHLPASRGPSPANFPPRMTGPYLHKPQFPENFGGAEAFDNAGQRTFDDWETFHSSGRRLVEYLRYNGHNALMLAALADGSTIYPSELLEPSPRYDTGAFASTGQDPVRKDVLELLFRLFDREGLALVPELQFSTPLTALERQIQEQGASAEGIALVGRDGRTWTETHGSSRGLAPYYNPLDPRVQAATLAVVRELVERYQTHPSFRGVALELSNLGFLQLPGTEWGYDGPTVARFERASGMRIPLSPDKNVYQQRYEYLTTKAAAQWTRWRCVEL